MASIHHQVAVEVGADEAWAALRLVGEAHKLFAPVLVEGRLEGEIRTACFANGMVVREPSSMSTMRDAAWPTRPWTGLE